MEGKSLTFTNCSLVLVWLDLNLLSVSSVDQVLQASQVSDRFIQQLLGISLEDNLQKRKWIKLTYCSNIVWNFMVHLFLSHNFYTMTNHSWKQRKTFKTWEWLKWDFTKSWFTKITYVHEFGRPNLMRIIY